MARPISRKVREIREALERRLRDGLHRPGDRFPSNRALAEQYGVSYQTAQRILHGMMDEGLIVRRRGAGTYLEGGHGRLKGVELLFHARARRRESFGAKLLSLMRSRLGKLGVETSARLIDPSTTTIPAARSGRLPVIWELPGAVERCAAERRQAIVLNDRPAGGFAATHIDSVSVDDFTGGACAAEMLAAAKRVAIFAGPEDDARSRDRVAGFLSVRRAPVVHAGGWYAEHGAAHAADVLRGKPDGVFCCNDRLAEAVFRYALEHSVQPPMLVGFDDAPIAVMLHLSTIAIPWPEFVGAALKVIIARMAGDRSAAIRQVVAPLPVQRWSPAGSQ